MSVRHVMRTGFPILVLLFVLTSSCQRFGSSSRTFGVVLGEPYLNVLTLNMFVKISRSPLLFLDSKRHIKIWQTYKDTLAGKRLVYGRLGLPLTFEFQTL